MPVKQLAEVIVAKRVDEITMGVDCAQRTLDVYHQGLRAPVRIDNTDQAISIYLSSLKGVVFIAIEPTNTYHERFVELAIKAGHTLYLVDAYRLRYYRDAIGQRAKTDPSDAVLLERYLGAEREHLRAYDPRSPAHQTLWRLIKRRAGVVESRKSIAQSWKGIATLGPSVRALLKHHDHFIEIVEREIHRMALRLGWGGDLERLQSIPGIGPLNAVILCSVYHRGSFKSADAFVAFLGLDVRVRDSGRFRGKRKLTKKGDSEPRRALFNGARNAARTPSFKAFYELLRARGLSTTAAYVAVSRKLVRLAYALMRDQSVFIPREIENPC